MVRQVASGLAALGVRPGERVGLVGPNSPRWVAADYAIQMSGAVTVPLPHPDSKEQWEHILTRSGIRICCVTGDGLVEQLISTTPSLTFIINLDGDAIQHEGVIGAQALRELGEAWARTHPDEIAERIETLNGDHVATVIFTSGTTGDPKGVVLTHDNLMATARAAVEAVPIRRSEVLLSYLPISHSFERLITTVIPLVAHSTSWTVWFVEDMTGLPAALLSVRPTIMVGVPLFWQRLRQRITSELKASTWLRLLLGHVLENEHEEVPAWQGLLTLSLTKRVGRVILARVGLRRCWLALSGAAPLDAGTQIFFGRLGMPIHQGWGLTETTALSTVQHPSDNAIGVVGPPLPGVELRIGSDGEVLVRGPNVFAGYLDDPPPGSPEVDAEGFLHTGDLGEIVDGGRLRVLDRIDDMIVTAGGRKIPPRMIESRLNGQPLIESAIVLGDGRPYLVALLALNGRAVSELVSDTETHPWAHPEVETRVAEGIATVNATLPEPEQIHTWSILPLGFPDEALTPTLKIRRRVVETLLASTIADMYAERPDRTDLA